MRAPTGCDRAEFAVAFRPLKGSLARRLGRFMLRALRARAKLQTAQGPASPLADALRMLRVSLGRPTPGRARVVLVTSSVPGEGKSFTFTPK